MKLEVMTVQEFDAVYHLMEQSFPRDEYRPYERQRAVLDDPAYRIHVLRGENGGIAAFITLWSLGDVAFVEHFAVEPSLRGGGIGSRLLSEIKGLYPGMICLEVELPETDMARRRIGFYERNGFVLNHYPYEQPAYDEQRAGVPLLIMTTPRAIDEKEFARMRDALYRRVYHCL